MQMLPETRLLPVAQPTPATHPAAAAYLSRQHLPGQPGAQDEQDTGQRRPVSDRTSAALRTWPGRRQMRGDLAPEIIGQKRTCQTDQRPTKRSVPVLLGPLRLPHGMLSMSVVAVMQYIINILRLLRQARRRGRPLKEYDNLLTYQGSTVMSSTRLFRQL